MEVEREFFAVGGWEEMVLRGVVRDGACGFEGGMGDGEFEGVVGTQENESENERAFLGPLR